MVRRMAASSFTHLILPAWGSDSTAPDEPGATLHAGTLHLPARTIQIDVPLMQELLHRARAAALLAYAPFSRFHVGAALIMADDPAHEIITGANVENSSYSLTQCAERTALQTAVARGHRRLRYLAVTCANTTAATQLRDRSLCGSCRQVLREFSDTETLVLLDRGTPEPTADVFDVERLLPHGFYFQR
jgi:cytidine deaminase